MNLLTRISATISATAESAVSRFENHDAIAQSALTEARRAVSKARIRHQRLKRSIDDIRTSLDEFQKQEQLWTTRAQTLVTTDEHRAMQCLEQRQRCRDQITTQHENLSKHETLEANMVGQLSQMETRLQNLINQRNEMRSRESLAQANQVMDRVDNHSQEGVEAIFERWELYISDTEMRNEVHQSDASDMSSLQRELDEEERQASLKDALAALIANNGKENSNEL